MFTTLAALTAFSSFALAALSPEQISFVFPSSKNLKGATALATDCFDATVIGNTTHALFVLQVIDSSKKATSKDVGWIGIGSGVTMVGSDDIVLWQDSKGWIISRREPNAATVTKMKDPGDAGASPEDFSIVQELSTKVGAKVAQVAFIRALTPSYKATSAYKNIKMAKSQSFIYARSSTAPDGDDATAEIGYHDVNMASFQLDLSQSVKATQKFGGGSVIAFTLPSSAKKETKVEVSSDQVEPAPSSSIVPRVEKHKKVKPSATETAEDPNDTPSFCQMYADQANGTNPCQKQKSSGATNVTSASLVVGTAEITASATSTSPEEGLAAASQEVTSFSGAAVNRPTLISIFLFVAFTWLI